MRGKSKLLIPALACLALASPLVAWSQNTALAPASSPSGEQARVLRIAECGGDGIQSGEAAALQSLIMSNVVELTMFRVIDAKGQELALQEAETAVQLGTTKQIAPLVADYILSARADRAGSFIIFTMDVTKASTGEKRSVSDTFSSENDIILSVRRLTRSLFEKQEAPSSPVLATPSPAPSPNPAPSLSLLAGTWKGDKNVDRVTLLPDGRGFAVLASGVRMSLKATIDGALVKIAQNQPNSPDFYRPGLDLKSARIVAQGARPWRWSFSLSSDGASLSGVKESVFVTVNERGAVSLDNNYVRDAVWTRLYR
jgi:hypothetical protein